MADVTSSTNLSAKDDLPDTNEFDARIHTFQTILPVGYTDSGRNYGNAPCKRP